MAEYVHGRDICVCSRIFPRLGSRPLMSRPGVLVAVLASEAKVNAHEDRG